MEFWITLTKTSNSGRTYPSYGYMKVAHRVWFDYKLDYADSNHCND